MADAKEKVADDCASMPKGWMGAFEADGEAASPKLRSAKLKAGCAEPAAGEGVLAGRFAACKHGQGHQYDMHRWP